MMQPEHTPLIEFKNVSKRYDNHTAVNELNLTIYQGEFFVADASIHEQQSIHPHLNPKN